MKMSLKRNEINPIKMSTNPPEEVVNAGWRLISDSYVYSYVGRGWVKDREATREDYQKIPQLID
jgi:hypothetical protein